MTPDQASLRQAAVTNCSADLLRELQHAHRIIQNGLQLMSVTQKDVWAERNARDGVDGKGTTRYHERAAVIARATGSAA
ncbi:hypothetical protein ACUXAV_000223 [Cupriavidus metallidurans]|jgi:hypothetical protein|uniref:hypothetical protein n=1 Tax=Cupriavidus TaxID=106589 RepID=UPI00049339D2|nr:hypothetical protein [Cupriavidus metallidurans]KWW37888.1 hypothetical protein AU374_01667 [Cupriavidus metallidurans]MDE4918185.1 hypothetical protein [Cupriavidus metallidurans]